MAFDPTKFVILAAQIVEPAKLPQEEHVRTACGRAYYSAFLVARERLITVGHIMPGAATGVSVHRYVIQRLSKSADGTVSALGLNLSDLFDKRKHADYELKSKYGFVQSFGALVALSARNWLEDFQKIPDTQLKAACPP